MTPPTLHGLALTFVVSARSLLRPRPVGLGLRAPLLGFASPLPFSRQQPLPTSSVRRPPPLRRALATRPEAPVHGVPPPLDGPCHAVAPEQCCSSMAGYGVHCVALPGPARRSPRRPRLQAHGLSHSARTLRRLSLADSRPRLTTRHFPLVVTDPPARRNGPPGSSQDPDLAAPRRNAIAASSGFVWTRCLGPLPAFPPGPTRRAPPPRGAETPPCNAAFLAVSGASPLRCFAIARPSPPPLQVAPPRRARQLTSSDLPQPESRPFRQYETAFVPASHSAFRLPRDFPSPASRPARLFPSLSRSCSLPESPRPPGTEAPFERTGADSRESLLLSTVPPLESSTAQRPRPLQHRRIPSFVPLLAEPPFHCRDSFPSTSADFRASSVNESVAPTGRCQPAGTRFFHGFCSPSRLALHRRPCPHGSRAIPPPLLPHSIPRDGLRHAAAFVRSRG